MFFEMYSTYISKVKTDPWSSAFSLIWTYPLGKKPVPKKRLGCEPTYVVSSCGDWDEVVEHPNTYMIHHDTIVTRVSYLPFWRTTIIIDMMEYIVRCDFCLVGGYLEDHPSKYS